MGRASTEFSMLGQEEDLERVAGVVTPKSTPAGHGPRFRVALAIAACCAATFACIAALTATPAASTVHAPLTVRRLLESQELFDLATDNILATGGSMSFGVAPPESREAASARVAKGLGQVQSSIRLHEPEAHAKLGQIELTPEQKEALLDNIHKFSDERVMGLIHAVVAAAQDAGEGADQNAVQQELAEQLAPRMPDIRELRKEMLDIHREMLRREREVIDILRREKDAVGAVAAKDEPREIALLEPRRVVGGPKSDTEDVHMQARALFHCLEHDIGAEMPKAPARMLYSTPYSSSQPQSQPSSDLDDHPSFMSCLMKAAPNPAKVGACVVGNFKEFISEAEHVVSRMLHH